MQLNRIVIVGAGAVGGTIGGFLARAGNDVAMIARGQHGAKIQADGLTVHRPTETFNIKTECFTNISKVNWRQGDLAILSTKLNDGEAALDNLLSAAGASLPVVCATNGIHGERWATKRFQNVISMMIWMPTAFLNPGEVSVYGQCPGVLDCGPVGNDLPSRQLSEKLCETLRNAGFESLFRDDISRWKHGKWIRNLANTAQALIVDDWKSVAKAAQAEGERVLAKAGINFIGYDQLRERSSMVNLLPVQGAKRPGGSTWQSLERGKPLETPWLEGAMADLGQVVGVPTPVNQILSEAGKDLRRLSAGEVLGQ